MQNNAVLITGAAGEIGQALLKALIGSPQTLVTLDLQDLPPEFSTKTTHIKGSITDKNLIAELGRTYEFGRIYHLAALLSTSAERKPSVAHEVNIDASASLLQLAADQSEAGGRRAVFVFPSSKAVYGMPDLKTKAAHPMVTEDEWTAPITLYGANKLMIEMLGRYYARNYKQLADAAPARLDFRSLRFPGLISAHTLPTGGTSDYGPEMLHAAAKGEAYACFVRPDTTMTFMAMPDAVKAILTLADAPADKLSRVAYNVKGFSLSAEDFREQVLQYFPDAKITYAPDTKRQQIVDSWPMDIDDTAARKDWGWSPDYDRQRCFDEYLVPSIKAGYA